MENAVQQPKPNRLRAGLLALLGLVAIGAVLYTTVLPMMSVGRPDPKKAFDQVAINVEQVSPEDQDGGGDATMPDGSARIETVPAGERHDPFKPIDGGKKPEGSKTPAKPNFGPPPADSGTVPTLPSIGSPGGFEPAPGLPAVPEFTQKNAPEESHDPIVMQGTAVGIESIVLFKRGNELLERRVGDYLGPYRITAIDHGKIRLIDEKKNSPWMESGQFLIPGGSGPTRFDPNAATRDGRPAPSTTVDPRSAAPTSGRFSAVPPAVRVSDNRWPSTIR